MASLRFACNFRSQLYCRRKTTLALVYEKHGNPDDVIKLREIPLSESIANDEIEVSILTAPVNPSDINQIQGTYPLKPVLPAIGGNEGVGVVRRCGQDVNGLSEGDMVIPILPGVGTWRSSVIAKASLFLKLPRSVPIDFGATLQVNPPTAYRMLKDFVSLQFGDTIIQNGSNSAVGQAVIQLAAVWGWKTINIIRARPDNSHENVIEYLKGLGADEVVTEDYLASHEMKLLMENYPKPKLALNCVGGKSSTAIVRYLQEKGLLVTYGGMSRQPVLIPTSALIFKEIQCVGYWNGLWLTRNKNNGHVIETMYNELCTLAIGNQLKAPKCNHYKLEEYKTALNNSLKPFVSSKQLLVIN